MICCTSEGTTERAELPRGRAHAATHERISKHKQIFEKFIQLPLGNICTWMPTATCPSPAPTLIVSQQLGKFAKRKSSGPVIRTIRKRTFCGLGLYLQHSSQPYWFRGMSRGNGNLYFALAGACPGCVAVVGNEHLSKRVKVDLHLGGTTSPAKTRSSHKADSCSVELD